MKNTKKGFTLVELLVVIAIVAILATVAIIGYTSFMDKADLSVDQQVVEQLNTALTAGSVGLNAEELTIQNVDKILTEAGFNMENGVNALRSGNKIYWFKSYNTIVLANNDGKVIFPIDNAELVEKFDINDTANVVNLSKLVEGSSVLGANGKIYSSFAEAVVDGGEITLFNDVVVETKSTIAIDTVINLNGHSLDASGLTKDRPFYVEAGVNLTINAENANIKIGAYGFVDVKKAGANANVVINGGTFTGNMNNGAFVKVREGADNVTITLNNVNYNDASTNNSYIFYKEAKATTLVVNGGTYNADMEYAYGCLFTKEPYKSFKNLFNVSGLRLCQKRAGRHCRSSRGRRRRRTRAGNAPRHRKLRHL